MNVIKTLIWGVLFLGVAKGGGIIAEAMELSFLTRMAIFIAAGVLMGFTVSGGHQLLAAIFFGVSIGVYPGLVREEHAS